MVPDEICDVTNQVTGSISQSLLAMQLIQRTQIQTYVICQSCFFFFKMEGLFLQHVLLLEVQTFYLEDQGQQSALGPHTRDPHPVRWPLDARIWEHVWLDVIWKSSPWSR